MTAKDQRPDQGAPSRAERLREQIKKITRRDRTPTAEEAQEPGQPKSLNEIIEERMRDHVGENEKKP